MSNPERTREEIRESVKKAKRKQWFVDHIGKTLWLLDKGVPIESATLGDTQVMWALANEEIAGCKVYFDTKEEVEKSNDKA